MDFPKKLIKVGKTLRAVDVGAAKEVKALGIKASAEFQGKVTRESARKMVFYLEFV